MYVASGKLKTTHLTVREGVHAGAAFEVYYAAFLVDEAGEPALRLCPTTTGRGHSAWLFL